MSCLYLNLITKVMRGRRARFLFGLPCTYVLWFNVSVCLLIHAPQQHATE